MTKTITYWETQAGALDPTRATPETAGLSLYSMNACKILPRTVQLIETGTGIQIPTKHFSWIVPQSTLALKGIQVVNGVIEAGYQGELKIILLNTSDENVHVQKKDRVAQIFIVPVLGGTITRGQSSPVTTIERKQISSMHEINSGAKI
ncbi:deoxyuridine 5'-triphosphate nucleotidohydrolase-like [Protopterus annectens]|uniref:deoxyuridine 5'-triphosphate nucleotidohydrolase-like n=1 Tax=Protopterus annectens TaxID=7888 RepID=UPI001CFBCD27|nr:deoxyuridine 5'-triphosphate nucleotidohydrolase-like [Protopterus annectens]